MLYLVDSSAKNLSGHNLEYLKRISEHAKSEFLILGRKDLNSDVNPKYRPTFEFGTWDFGRFGFARKNHEERFGQKRKTLRPTWRFILTEKYVEKLAAVLAKKLQKSILTIAAFSKQSRFYRHDLSVALKGMSLGSTILISTANARELIGLNKWINEFKPKKCSIIVILRRPIIDLRSYLELPLVFADALIHISVIKELGHKVRFFADSQGLAARISETSGKDIKYIAAMGFETQTKKRNSLLDVAIAPNSRSETRFGVRDLFSIPDLNSQVKSNLNSTEYRELLLRTRSLVLPYDPLRYRSRSSGVFAEALTLGILPIVPTGTSMSREITFLNSKILSIPKFVVELKARNRIDLSQFGQEDLIITIKARNACSLNLEISDSTFGIRKSVHDFYGLNSADSFLIRPSQPTFISYHSDRVFFEQNDGLILSVYKLEEALFGASYLEGDLKSTLSITRRISFSPKDELAIREHSPTSIRSALEI